MRPGGTSPWGIIQNVEQLVPGVWTASTAGHGGIKLDAKRNAAIPANARAADGWYEEDCDWAIPAFIHNDVGDSILGSASRGVPGELDKGYIPDCLKRWQTTEVLEALGLG